MKFFFNRVPVQYIIKEWEFRDSVLTMQPPVFIPRPETEMLIDIVKESTADDDLKTGLEVGCGTGAISISLLKEYKEVSATYRKIKIPFTYNVTKFIK